jgi:hypothetical protein
MKAVRYHHLGDAVVLRRLWVASAFPTAVG